MSNFFKRPESLSFPTIFYTFKARDKNSDNIVEYRVQDLPEECFERVLEMMVKHFLPEESLCCSIKLHQDQASVEAICDFWREAMKSRLSIGCFKDDEIVGANVLVVNSAEQKEEAKFANQDLQEVLNIMDFTTKQFDVYKAYDVDKYLTAYGLCVNPEYRGRSIATEMLKARAPILKALGLKVTSTAFTGIGSQLAARKAGYQEVFVMSYEEIQKLFPRCDFSSCSAKCFKTLALKL